MELVIALSMTDSIKDLVGIFVPMLIGIGRILAVWGICEMAIGLRSNDAAAMPRAVKLLLSAIVLTNIDIACGTVLKNLGLTTSVLIYSTAWTNLQLNNAGIYNSFRFLEEVSKIAVSFVGAFMLILDVFDIAMAMQSHDHQNMPSVAKHLVAAVMCIFVTLLCTNIGIR